MYWYCIKKAMNCIGITSKINALHRHRIGKQCKPMPPNYGALLCQCNTDSLYQRIQCKQCDMGPCIALAM
jgi:hypothetical protein